MPTHMLAALKRSPMAIAMIIIAAVVMVAVSETSNQRALTMVQQASTQGLVRLQLIDVALAIQDAESGQRGYLLTGREEYLKPYQEALPKIASSFKTLSDFYADDAATLERIEALRHLTDTKLSELQLTVQLAKAGKRQTSVDIVLLGIGNDYMGAVRGLSAELVARESARIEANRKNIVDTLLFTRLAVAALSVISLLAILVSLRQSAALEAQQDEHKRVLKAEQERLEREVAQRTAQLRELNNHLQTAREDERHRLARDLHDELGALLTSAKLDAARIKSRIAGTSPEAVERLSHLVETLNAGIALKRRIIEDLRPSALSNLGLMPTLEILAREFAERSGLQVHCELQPVHLTPSADLVVYRLVQEAITNITKYARARQVWLDVAERDGWVEASVRDDGVGFDPRRVAATAHGLLGMRYRVEAESGTLDLVSAPGQGTQIRARLPRAAAQPAAEGQAP
jgi:signal transduction histidine kinase